MKLFYTSIFSLALGGLFFSFHIQEKGAYGAYNTKRFHTLNSGGASAGNTGAPGENNCTACHSGTVQSGDGINILDWGADETYTPGATYPITLTLNDASAKNGFQLTALTENNLPAGTLVATNAAATQILNGIGGKQYLGHRQGGNSLSSWSFEWTAPSSNQGPVTFYVATNKTNGQGNTSGDVIRLSQHVFDAQSTASISAYEVLKNSLSISLNAQANYLDINFEANELEDLYVNIVSLQGQSVLAESIGSSEIGKNKKQVQLPSDLTSGIYVVHLMVGNKAYSQKVVLP